MVRVYYSEFNWERLRRAKELATRYRCTPNQIALAFVLNQPFPTFALIGPRTLAELHESLGAMELVLSSREVRWLNLESNIRP